MVARADAAVDGAQRGLGDGATGYVGYYSFGRSVLAAVPGNLGDRACWRFRCWVRY